MLRRHIQFILLEALTFMPVVLLRGARQTGKTTLVKRLCADFPDYQYITFDHLPTLMAAKEDPVNFISRQQKPVILDEVQRVPELFLPLKRDVDENRQPGQYLLTGSADPLLLPKLGDSLAGRMRLLNLWPCSQGEILGRQETLLDTLFGKGPLPLREDPSCSKEALLTRVVRGGYPGVLPLEIEHQRHAWFNDYVTLVLQKDVLDLSRIENVTQLPHLLALLAMRIGGLLNKEELARTAKLQAMTLHRYLNLLRTLFMVFFLPAWSGHLSKRLVKSPKTYLPDTALALFLLNVDQDRLRQEPHLFGNLLENFVVLELLKQTSWSTKSIQMYHYRDYQNSEIDLILEGPGGDLVAIEIKSSETLSKDDFKGLKRFQEIVGERCLHGILLYAGTAALPFGKQLTALPISALWS